MFGADRRDGAGAHVGDDGGVEDGARRAGARVEQVEDAEFRRQAVQVVVDIVADDLDAGRVERRDVAAQHVEMAVEGGVRLEMHARLDHRLAVALRDERRPPPRPGSPRRSWPGRRCRARSGSRCRSASFYAHTFLSRSAHPIAGRGVTRKFVAPSLDAVGRMLFKPVPS